MAKTSAERVKAYREKNKMRTIELPEWMFQAIDEACKAHKEKWKTRFGENDLFGNLPPGEDESWRAKIEYLLFYAVPNYFPTHKEHRDFLRKHQS